MLSTLCEHTECGNYQRPVSEKKKLKASPMVPHTPMPILSHLWDFVDPRQTSKTKNKKKSIEKQRRDANEVTGGW